ncbi:hypothetical protein R1CP_38755 (plasmid) [Rhodococcus opacus]|uniref:Uncharacterized protein n=1 Tax=Rhodococcus opacus TaxID=37919 RepID=A0A1B1KI99_RHOOP|nr:hypothetical protein R1CP_38250 [Rhodococcus opacus]ANS32343.1 hypothetical protein R1CP_38755 [Rhodococcus opacus]
MHKPGTRRELVVSEKNKIADDVVELILTSPDEQRNLQHGSPCSHHLAPSGSAKVQYLLCGADRPDGSWATPCTGHHSRPAADDTYTMNWPQAVLWSFRCNTVQLVRVALR